MTLHFIDTLFQKPHSETPIWMMRQAGRYLPEYREVRKNFTQFLDFCYTPDAACEVTLQPITRFDFDAAILFSDILVIPDALGQKVWFEAGEGPRLEAIVSEAQFKQLSMNKMEETLDPVFQAIKKIRAALPKEKPLIGFSGSPWTLACYMIEGKGSKDFAITREFSYKEPVLFAQLISLLTDAIIAYAKKQIESGINVFQLFDSWAGVLAEESFDQWVILPTQKIVCALKSNHPEIPVIGFARGAGMKLGKYVKQTGIDGIGIDTSMPLAEVVSHYAHGKTIQGNLDPTLLASSQKEAIVQTKKILEVTKSIPHIFNLGHGILPHTPIDHVQAIIDCVRQHQK